MDESNLIIGHIHGIAADCIGTAMLGALVGLGNLLAIPGAALSSGIYQYAALTDTVFRGDFRVGLDTISQFFRIHQAEGLNGTLVGLYNNLTPDHQHFLHNIVRDLGEFFQREFQTLNALRIEFCHTLHPLQSLKLKHKVLAELIPSRDNLRGSEVGCQDGPA